ncbi:uncharacterized protein FOMMEDRAFT_96519 [Fomitiporia mediterranea MF3/22]|uniref:uncharacterized protein n=1 Tax=Fomitiporia mediterranea (strain MF3/22) TaxID=694068 RepID=UPI0004409269|nr:uncharacterized protein FOMMEDRAFT_96519 [Fomitiporia mediterranea MF3/22]EJC98525.1 hypothetical protein FOMMEDRAFT_96519 [Fomitiporia mediterranea MF3/22]
MAGQRRRFFKRKQAWRKRKQHEPQTANEDTGVDDSVDSGGEEEAAQKKVRWDVNESTEEKDEEESSRKKQEESDSDASICRFRVGCAYYDPVRQVMCILEDSVEGSQCDLTKLLLEQISPDVVVTSTRADENSIDTIREFVDNSGGVFQIRPAREFMPVKGRDRLLSLSFLSELACDDRLASSSVHSSSDTPSNVYDFMRRRREITGDPSMKRWNASVRAGNFASLEGSPLCLSAIGALLEHLAKVRAMADLENEGISGLEIRAIESICLEQFMQINADALLSLQVFDTQSHAAVHSDKTKEGLSLFGILNTTRTNLGRLLLRQWLLRPSLSLSVIAARHDAVECLTMPENIVTADAMCSHLKGLRNVPRTMRLLKTGKAGLNEWQGLVKFTFHASLIKEALMELNHIGEIEMLKKIIAILDVTSFRDVGNAIHETVDWEESVHAGRVCVRPNIDEELDKWKHIYNGIDGVLSRVASQVSETVPPDYTTSLNVVYFPQLGKYLTLLSLYHLTDFVVGFLICIPKKEDQSPEQGIDVLDGWSFQFSSETHVYFKSDQMHDMDRHIGDLHPSIVDREIEIMQALLDKILQFDDAIAQACDILAELDCLLCFADAARLYSYRRPTMTDKNVLCICQGRHPLQEQVVDTFVPNDVYVRGGLGSGPDPEGKEMPEDEDIPADTKGILLLTGANACGKVYRVASTLSFFLVSADVAFSFVPAESATVGIVDKIFTRVQTRETVSKIQSAFMTDLNQVSLALRNSTPRSLILLDEFGKGTVSRGQLNNHGAGLLCGVLHSLLSRGPECPKVLIATHFQDVFHSDLLESDLPVTFLHMEILLPDRSEEDEDQGQDMDANAYLRVLRGETITYLYRFAPGLSLDSHAARCAQMFGLPSAIVRRAQRVSSVLATHDITRLLDEDMEPEEIDDLAQAEMICRHFIAWDLSVATSVVESVGIGGVKEKLAGVLGIGETESDRNDTD